MLQFNLEQTESSLKEIEEWVGKFLLHSCGFMPLKFAKLVSLYYTDAKVRKHYAHFLGVEMGDGSYANLGLKVIPNHNNICVHIKENVSIGPNVTFICNSEPNNSQKMQAIPYVRNHLIKNADITVESNAWLGANCTIFPGVTIGECSIIGAGSVVLKDVEPYSIYAGVPAKKIRDLQTGERCDRKE